MPTWVERTRGGKRGRGSQNKVPFIAALQLDDSGRPKRAIFSRIRTFSREEVSRWARRHIAPDSIVVSDGLDCFSAIKKEGIGHMPITVGTTRKSSDMPCFKWINTIIRNLKTANKRTYHLFDFEKYGVLYLTEAQYRSIAGSICPRSFSRCLEMRSEQSSGLKCRCAKLKVDANQQIYLLEYSASPTSNSKTHKINLNFMDRGLT
jgi:hypothetical protein